MSCGQTTKSKSIKSVFARKPIRFRGNPTVEVDLITDLGLFRAAVPSGASAAVIIRCADQRAQLDPTVAKVSKNSARTARRKPRRIPWQGVSRAIDNINNCIGPELVNQSFCVTEQEKIDEFMLKPDGTGKQIEIARTRHIADLAGNKNFILPVPASNVINGGSHAGNKLAMQEFMILPTGACSFKEAMKMGSETYQHLKKVIKRTLRPRRYSLSETRAVSHPIFKNSDALDLLADAIAKAGYTGRIEIGMDVASSEFYKEGMYDLDFKNPKSDKKAWVSSDKLAQIYQDMMDKYPIVSIEDPFEQDDWDAWTKLTASVNIQIVGDDLTVTNPKRIQTGIDKNACSVTESIKAHLLAKSAGWGTMVSHRSGETEDTFIADLVVGLSTGQIKTGAPCRSERLAKYNQILRIEEELCSKARFAGKAFHKPLIIKVITISVRCQQPTLIRDNPKPIKYLNYYVKQGQTSERHHESPYSKSS
ncbi:hypothetical protein NQ317_017641 [Molorchus minor]|uniref:Enolase n=1 Tax=Molorchus minor TaxID=1323400 RepID=A0ABQ9JJP2_9CUCU|nr:hypothetical protein NQ317_017641 [Molorchus minor]